MPAMARNNRRPKEEPALEKAPDAFRTISEVADELDLPQHVLRFWETRFGQIKPLKRGGGRRYYRPDDVDLLRGIRHLLYGDGYTIRGVQRILKDSGPKFVQSVWQAGAPQPSKLPSDVDDVDEMPDGRGALGIASRGAAANRGSADGSSAKLPRGVEVVRQRTNIRPQSVVPVAAANSARSANAALGREDVLKLRAALDELSECRRLLDAAIAESS
jgi:DNA-binding transcriptional MerR regulator